MTKMLQLDAVMNYFNEVCRSIPLMPEYYCHVHHKIALKMLPVCAIYCGMFSGFILVSAC